MRTDIFRTRLAPAAFGRSLALGLAGCAGVADFTSSVMRGGSEPVPATGEGGDAVAVSASARHDEESVTGVSRSGTCDDVRAGARLAPSFYPAAPAFTGTVTNTTDATLNRVRIEAHLSNGVELGPTAPQDLSPGQSVEIALNASDQAFSSWSAHPEVGGVGRPRDVRADEPGRRSDVGRTNAARRRRP